MINTTHYTLSKHTTSHQTVHTLNPIHEVYTKPQTYHTLDQTPSLTQYMLHTTIYNSSIVLTEFLPVTAKAWAGQHIGCSYVTSLHIT